MGSEGTTRNAIVYANSCIGNVKSFWGEFSSNHIEGAIKA